MGNAHNLSSMAQHFEQGNATRNMQLEICNRERCLISTQTAMYMFEAK